MKNINKTIIALIILISYQCKSQNPTIDLADRNGNRTNNAYYKDVNNVLNPFEGTWVFDDGVNYLKIVLQKKYQAFTGAYYEDIIIGEYQFKKNGQEIINSLPLNSSLSNVYNHKIYGNNLPFTTTPFNDYTSDNFRIKLVFSEPQLTFEIDLRKAIVNGKEAIQIFKRTGYVKHIKGQPELLYFVPNGFYYLIKQ